ncbi:MAG: hypothetical protein JWR00_603, partial [Rubritepida sp.]|nr:hypothetical protein [Rubritepida sp.]
LTWEGNARRVVAIAEAEIVALGRPRRTRPRNSAALRR